METQLHRHSLCELGQVTPSLSFIICLEGEIEGSKCHCNSLDLPLRTSPQSWGRLFPSDHRALFLSSNDHVALKCHPLWLVFASRLKQTLELNQANESLGFPTLYKWTHFMTTQLNYPPAKGQERPDFALLQVGHFAGVAHGVMMERGEASLPGINWKRRSVIGPERHKMQECFKGCLAHSHSAQTAGQDVAQPGCSLLIS